MRTRYILYTFLLSLLPSTTFGQTQANCKFLTFAVSSSDTLLEVNGISPSGINSSGVAVGEYEDSEAFFHGFIYKNGVFENVIYPGSRNTFVQGINNVGLITGLAFFSDGTNKGFIASCQ